MKSPLLRKLGLGLALALVFGATAAFAVNVAITYSPAWLKGGVWIGTTAATSNNHKITSSYAGSATWDFASIGGGQPVCARSAKLAITGVGYTDRCEVSTNFGQDGGLMAPVDVVFFCEPVTDGVYFKACYFSADAGTVGPVDLPDGGFTATTFGYR